MQSHPSNVVAAIIFTYSAAWSTRTGEHVAAAFCILYGSLWAFLTYFSTDGWFSTLPTRRNFLKSLDPTNASGIHLDECGICLEESPPPAKLPCGDTYCVSCVRRVYSSKSRDRRCPHCRRKIFQPAAPWDTPKVKIEICTLVFGVVYGPCLAGLVTWHCRRHWFELSNCAWRVGASSFFLLMSGYCAWTLRWAWYRLDKHHLKLWRREESRWACIEYTLFAPAVCYLSRALSMKMMEMLAWPVSPEYGLVSEYFEWRTRQICRDFSF